MTFRSIATTAVLAATVGAAALVALPGSAAQAETALPFGTPTVKSLGLTSPVRDMVLAGGKLWVSTGNEVDVFSTAGAKLGVVTGLLGASDLTASPDGTGVYVALAQDSRIITLSTATTAQTAAWTTSPCPTHLALAAGRLFYSYGCGGSGAGLTSLDPADGSAGPVVATLASAVALAGAGSTLITADQSGSPTAMTSYLATADGTATEQASMRTGEGYDFALSPDGSTLIVTGYDSGYTIERFKTVDLSAAGTFEMGYYPKAVAYSPDGTTFAGAITSNPDDFIRVINSNSGTLIGHSTVAGTNPGIVSGTLQYSADGTRLYGVVPADGTAKLIIATAGPVVASKLSATVTGPKAYGASTTIRISTPGRARAKVSVVVPALTGTKTYSATASASGSVVIHPKVTLSGTVTVTVPGDLTHAAKRVTKPLKVPAKLSASPTGYYSTAGGMRHYHSVGAVYVTLVAQPKRQVVMGIKLQVKVSGHWVTVDSGQYTTTYEGRGALVLKSGNKHRPYRVVASFAGDSYNSKAPTVTSKTFIVD